MTIELMTAATLARAGLGPADIARRVAGGTLVRVRRGVYRTAGNLAVTAAHRLMIQATLGELGDGAVLSHGSAAVLLGLPVPYAALGQVSVTRSRRGGGNVSAGVHLRGCPLPDPEVVSIDGRPVTSLERTVVDLARSLPFDWGVAVADAALRLGATPGLLAEQVDRARRRPGNRRARAVVAFADARAESAGESRSRAIFAQACLPAPSLQYEVRKDGVLLGRPDFGWEADGVLGEFDGLVKYGALARPGETPGDAVAREKVREDRMRALGWLVVRWVWAELDSPDELCRRVRGTLELGRSLARR